MTVGSVALHEKVVARHC